MTFTDVAYSAGCRRRGCDVRSFYDVAKGQTIVVHANHPEGRLVFRDEELDHLSNDGWAYNVLRRIHAWGKAIHDYEDGKLAYLADITQVPEGASQ